MSNLVELQRRYQEIVTQSLPTLKAEQASLQQRQQEHRAKLQELGWDGVQPLSAWLAALTQQRDATSAEAAAVLKEAEDAVAAVEQPASS